MLKMRSIAAASVFALGLTALAAAPAGAATADDDREYVVLFAEGVSSADARAAVEAAGGTVVAENEAVGVATVTAGSGFAAAADAQAAIEGTAENRVIGDVPESRAANGEARKADAVEQETVEAGLADGPSTANAAKGAKGEKGKKHRPNTPEAEPLADLQWDMQQIDATVDGSYARQQGSKGVRVGIIDTGVDGSHPDIAPNFDAVLSRNFTVDIPVDANGDEVDGACADDPDGSCEDAADVDENGHGTHVASTIGSPINGLGMAGVAPNVTLVNLRAGQDSGYFFLQPSIDALTYAGDNGIDVVNMSYYVDPWLFNCTDNPADSAADQEEQQTIIAAMQRALDYARGNGVTLIAAAGNEAIDYTKAVTDSGSPDFASVPGEAAYVRDLVDPASCVSMPAEGDGVISVSSTGISERKAYYSSYGNGYIDVAAPGGDSYDTPAGTRDVTKTILAAYPESLAIANGQIDENGEPLVSNIVRSCDDEGTCGYYQFIQGTSMASPHAAGVAALIVSQYGAKDPLKGGLRMNPNAVESKLLKTAVDESCPVPADFTYTRNLPNGSVSTATHTCESAKKTNGFYGSGIVNAMAAIGR
ncbi:S8 family serine peptidase [Agromyces sp. NPDC058136]|uniref:S8 family peptidase n=1 Tax=Agromyces sp. NPDC058136 TaxID=3346354 RepID=UPI0036DDD1E3